MKTKLLLTISLICLLVASTQAAIPYEYFPNRSEADGETPGAKIPNCIHQRGFRCFACGPDTEQEPAVPLFPNSLNQCIPNPSGSGCNRFLDVQGNVCDLDQGCNCKFVVNSIGTTCVTSTIPNCFILAADGTCAQCIGTGRSASYRDKFNILRSLTQKTPVGGGVSDYGRSFDGKSCVDNLPNGNPHCIEYLNATSCNLCDDDFVLVQTGTPTASLRKCVKIPNFTAKGSCFVHTLDGKRCFTCEANFALNTSGGCSPISDPNFIPGADFPVSTNCLRYQKGPDGKDNASKCLKCVNFSFQLQDGSCSELLTNEDQQINYVTGEIRNNKGGFCRLYYEADFNDQLLNSVEKFQYCLVKKAANDYYIAEAAAAASTDSPRTDFNCQNFDWTAGKCLTCQANYYLNTIDGSCYSVLAGTCKLTGCKVANGNAYCTECLRGFNLVDGTCVANNFADSDTVARCKTVTNGECTECDPEYYLDLKDSLSSSSTKKNRCILLDTSISPSDCATWVAGKCTACQQLGKVIVNGLCQWAPDATFGGVPGCAIHSADGVCETPYPNAFLSTDKKFTRIISNECASYDGDGNCTSVNNIQYILNFDYTKGLFVSQSMGSGGYCEKSYDGGCTCVSCKTSFTLDGNQACPANKDASLNNIDPVDVVRGCVDFATGTTCKQCRSPDFIPTPLSDGNCYDLTYQRRVSVAAGWASLFVRLNDAAQTGGALLDQAATTPYNPTFDFFPLINYEACTAASGLNTCTTCFAGRPNNIISVTLSAADAAYFTSAITYCHDNTDSAFTSGVSFTAGGNRSSVLVRDQVGNGARDTSALQLDRVKGCITYTSLVLGTCANCGTDYTKSTDSTKCLQKNGDVIDGTNPNGCGTIDPTDGQCLTCPDTQAYIYDTTAQTCTARDGNSSYKYCLTQDLTTGQCLTCIPSTVFTLSTNSASNVCKPVLDTSVSSCYSACAVGTATYIAAVIGPPSVSAYLQAATCGKGYTLDTNKNCIRNKSDWSTSVTEIDAQTGNFLSCNSGYALFKTATLTVCIPAIANCKTHSFTNNVVACSECAVDANGMPYFLVNSNKLCLSAQNYLPNCDVYNSSGTGCLKCNNASQNLEAVGCNLPPNCNAIDSNNLRCMTCSTGFKMTPTGDCIMPLPGKWAASADCFAAFNATHCAECGNGKIIAIDDLNNDDLYGVGECVGLTNNGCTLPTGCELTLRNKDLLNCALTTYECIRCQRGYSNFGGQCYDNSNSDHLFPTECVNVEYDEDQKAYVCTECDFGFAITTDRKQCIPNYGPCSYLDSTDCAQYDLPKGHEEVHIECAGERESSSIIISAFLLIILNVIFLTI